MPRKKPTPAPEPAATKAGPEQLTTDEARAVAWTIRVNQSPVGVMAPVIQRFQRVLLTSAMSSYEKLGFDSSERDRLLPIFIEWFGGAFVLGYLVADSEHPKAEAK